jgi:hypothetical protein
VRVNRRVIIEPETITVEEIEAERNLEVRRVLMERFGLARYLTASKSVLLDEDRDTLGHRRRLWSKDVAGDEPLVMVEVTNSTPEPDGTRKIYFLRVDPQLRPLPPGDWPPEKQRVWLSDQKPQAPTAHNAVASTWGMRGEDYRPTVET